jgi:hypothetical protein
MARLAATASHRCGTPKSPQPLCFRVFPLFFWWVVLLRARAAVEDTSSNVAAVACVVAFRGCTCKCGKFAL